MDEVPTAPKCASNKKPTLLATASPIQMLMLTAAICVVSSPSAATRKVKSSDGGPQSGSPKLNLGTDSYRAKRMRGAQFRTLDAYVCPCHETDRPFVDALLRRLDEHTAARLAAEGAHTLI